MKKNLKKKLLSITKWESEHVDSGLFEYCQHERNFNKIQIEEIFNLFICSTSCSERYLNIENYIIDYLNLDLSHTETLRIDEDKILSFITYSVKYSPAPLYRALAFFNLLELYNNKLSIAHKKYIELWYGNSLSFKKNIINNEHGFQLFYDLEPEYRFYSPTCYRSISDEYLDFNFIHFTSPYLLSIHTVDNILSKILLNIEDPNEFLKKLIKVLKLEFLLLQSVSGHLNNELNDYHNFLGDGLVQERNFYNDIKNLLFYSIPKKNEAKIRDYWLLFVSVYLLKEKGMKLKNAFVEYSKKDKCKLEPDTVERRYYEKVLELKGKYNTEIKFNELSKKNKTKIVEDIIYEFNLNQDLNKLGIKYHE